MIGLSITGKEKILLTELPQDIYQLHNKLYTELGIHLFPGNIKLIDSNDRIVSVKLSSVDELGEHLIKLFTPQNTVEDVNSAANIVANADEHIKEELYANIKADKYRFANEMYKDIKDMIYKAAPVQETFYFPLTGNIYDSECGDYFETDNGTLLRNEYQIREALEAYWDSDTEHMADYYDEIGHEKVLSVIWDVECIGNKLYGKVEARFTEPLTDAETEALKEWISGQNSDGLGEGFEQREIYTEDGTLTVSMWHHNDDYFVYTEDEMDDYISRQSVGMGGM